MGCRALKLPFSEVAPCPFFRLRETLSVYPTIYPPPPPHPKWKFWICYPHSNVLLQSWFNLECCKSQEAAHHPTKCDVKIDFKLFPTVYRRKILYHRIYCRKFLTLSNQTSHYKSKCIRIHALLSELSTKHSFIIYTSNSGQFML